MTTITTTRGDPPKPRTQKKPSIRKGATKRPNCAKRSTLGGNQGDQSVPSVQADLVVLPPNSPQGEAAGQQPVSPSMAATGVHVCVERVEQWRMSSDILYRLFTCSDSTELNHCVLGLIASGSYGNEVGLLRRKYTQAAVQSGFAQQTVRFLDRMEGLIVQAENEKCGELHRTACHFMLMAAIVLEEEFLQYVLLRSHNREALRYFVNDVLRRDLSQLLLGTLAQGSQDDKLLFDIGTFVRQSRLNYAIHCSPAPTPQLI